MKNWLISPLCAVLLSPVAWALPQDFGDLGDIALFGGGLALDGRELTDGFLDPAVWRGEAELPGKWREAYSLDVVNRRVAHIAAAPYLFGHVPIGVEAVYEEKNLDRVSIYYLESGTFFGYQPKLKDSVEGRKALQEKQRLFRKVFAELEKSLSGRLEEITDDRGKTLVEGKTSVFKRRYRHYEKDGLALQLHAKKDYYVRLDLKRAVEVTEGFIPIELEGLRKKERAQRLVRNVAQNPNGDVSLKGIPMIYQGGRAYCGITTFLMAAQYLGIHMDPATMASESGFRYGMGGKKMIEAYNAVAREGGLRLKRATKLDVERLKASIDEGVPVMVWRRFDVKRNRLHTSRSRMARVSGGTRALPEPDESDRSTWPGKGAPAHASVITGYNEERNEVIFSESWGDHARDKRMRWEELAATAYYTFYFSL